MRDNSSQNLNEFIRDVLQPNDEFHRLFNNAIDSLHRNLQTFTGYGNENPIKVNGETSPYPSPPALNYRVRCLAPNDPPLITILLECLMCFSVTLYQLVQCVYVHLIERFHSRGQHLC